METYLEIKAFAESCKKDKVQRIFLDREDKKIDTKEGPAFFTIITATAKKGNEVMVHQKVAQADEAQAVYEDARAVLEKTGIDLCLGSTS